MKLSSNVISFFFFKAKPDKHNQACLGHNKLTTKSLQNNNNSISSSSRELIKNNLMSSAREKIMTAAHPQFIHYSKLKIESQQIEHKNINGWTEKQKQLCTPIAQSDHKQFLGLPLWMLFEGLSMLLYSLDN